MPQNGCERDLHRQIGRQAAGPAPGQPREDQGRQEALQKIQGEDQEEITKAQQSADVRRADVARSDRSDVNPLRDSNGQIGERDGPDQIGGNEGERL